MSAPSYSPTFLRVLWLHLRKDLQIEWRAREAVVAMLFFSLLVVVVFAMAFEPTGDMSRQIAGAILCVATLFAAVTTLNQSWVREMRNDVLDAQRMTSASPQALFLSKVVANFLFVSIVQVVLTPVFVIFYNLHPLGNAWLFLLILPFGNWALVINGTFFAALSMRARSRELLLPLILFPVFLPALLGMVLACTDVLTGNDVPVLWIKLLAGYDVIYTTVSLLLFELVLSAE